MIFPENIMYWGNAVLRHDSENNKSFLYFINRKLSKNKVDEKTIEKICSEYKLIFCNHFVETSHYVNFISKNKIAQGKRDEFFHYMLIFFKQFYPDYDLLKEVNDESSLMLLFNKCYERINTLLGQFLENYDMQCVRNNMESVNKIYDFYDKIEDFMIRFYGYSIIGISNEKRIITACSDCDKKFIDYLLQGYTLYRLQRLAFVENNKEPYYEFLPVLPTKDVGFPIDEYIEVSEPVDEKSNIKRLRFIK